MTIVPERLDLTVFTQIGFWKGQLQETDFSGMFPFRDLEMQGPGVR
jgi:hypothetical protein